ncbi:EcsC family protein [Bacillus sp. FJAT-47783]|uniref:EcsC family protein n=1 Tax=Bacillus sp. FJAT-47783 TaxID=2922712 RepID=UPI001FAD2693|nr:EcsC family protein [Bacillus sp. FJAT-47783]
MLTNREKDLYDEILVWEQDISLDHRSDFKRTYDYWLERKIDQLPFSIRKNVFSKLDQFLFYFHSIIQNSDWQSESRKRLLNMARLLDDSITSIHDLKRLKIDQIRYLAEMEVSKHRLTSLAQGAVTGTGGMFLLGIDLPAQLAINLRAVQMMAMCYGNEVNSPYEMMLSLKVFHASLMPDYLAYKQWVVFKKELFEHSDNPYLYSGSEQFASESTLKHMTEQIGKLFFIQFFKRKTIQTIPFIGIAVGASVNYKLTKRCTTFAQNVYQYRLLLERKGK